MRIGQHEAGLGVTGWLGSMALIVIVLLLTIKIAPLYIENHTVKSIIQTIAKEVPPSSEISMQEYQRTITSKFEKNLQVNAITNVTVDNLIITQENQGVVLELKYDVKRPLVGNMELVIHFDDQVVVSP